MNDHVQTHQIIKGLVVKVQHSAVVCGPIQRRVVSGNGTGNVVSLTKDLGGNLRKSCDQIHSIIKGAAPVLLLGNTLLQQGKKKKEKKKFFKKKKKKIK